MGTSNIAFLLAHDTAAPTQLSVLNALLGAMRAIKADPQNAAQEWHEILDDLAKAIDANAKPAAVSAAEWTLLQAEWGELKDRLREQLPAALRPLTYKLAEVAAATFPPATEKGLITYPVTSSRTAAQPVLVGGMQFHAEGAASASASAELQVYTSAPAWTKKGGYSLPQSEALATLRVRGNLGVTGSATSPQPWGAIQVGGSAKASASLRYGFDYPSSRYLAQALIDTFPQLAAPGDLSRTLQACQGQDFGIIHLNVNGELALNASLSAGHAFVEHIGAGKTLERIADAKLKPAKVGVSVGAKVGFSWKIAGDFDLSVVRKDGGALVTLERQAHRNTGASVDVGAEIDIQGLQGMLDPVMEKILPRAEPLIARLGEMSDLQALALEAAERAVGKVPAGSWQRIAQALVDTVLGPGAPAASESLAGSLADAFDKFAKAYVTQAAGAVAAAEGAIKAALAQATGIPQPLSQLVDAQVTACLGGVSAAIDGAYSDMVQRLEQAAQAGIADLLSPLDVPAARVRDFLTELKNKVTTATQPLVDWLEKYEQARKRIAAVIAQVEREKLALGLAWKYLETRSTVSLLQVHFTRDTPAARALYKAFWMGRLDGYDALLADCRSDGSAEEVSNVFTDTLQRSGTKAFTFTAFGFLAVAATTQTLERIMVKAEGNRIVAATSQVSLETVLTAREKVTKAAIAIELPMLASAESAPPFQANFRAMGGEITRKDIAHFFMLLERSGAVSDNVDDKVLEMLWDGTPAAAAKVNASLTSYYLPGAEGWLRLLATPPQRVAQAVRARCFEMLRLEVDAETEPTLMSEPPDWLTTFLAPSGYSEEEFWLRAGTRLQRPWCEDIGNKAGVQTANTSSPAYRTLARLWEIGRIGHGAGNAIAAAAGARAYLDSLAGGSVAREQVLKELARLSEAITLGLSAAFEYPVPDYARPTRVSWQFLGLVLGLSDLMDGRGGPRFVTRVEAALSGRQLAKVFA